MFYLYEIRESDGNDCTVYDAIVEAESREVADEKVSDHFDAEAKSKNWEPDGNFGGYFFPCDCDIPTLPPEEIPCPQCEALMINGVFCHETGCPIQRERKQLQRTIDNWECSHGGLSVSDEPEEFETEEEAEAALRSYHTRYYI